MRRQISSICSVNGTILSIPGTSEITVLGGSVVTVALANTRGVNSWSISATQSDDLTCNSGNLLAVNQSKVHKGCSATFVVPAVISGRGAALQFTSIVNVGMPSQSSSSFGVLVLNTNGTRLFCGSETTQSNAAVWNTTHVNGLTVLGGGSEVSHAGRPTYPKDQPEPSKSSGIGVWSPTTSYNNGDLVVYITGIFESITDVNMGRKPNDQRYWTPTGMFGNGFWNVRWFGATGDGTTDDTTAIQNAIYAGTQGVVYFPPGQYRVTQPLEIIADSTSKWNGFDGYGNATIWNMTFRGANATPDGNGQSIILWDGIVTLPLFKCYSRGNLFEYLQIETKGSSAGYAISVVTQSTGTESQSVTNNTWRKCALFGNFMYGISVGNDPADLINGTKLTEGQCDYNLFEDVHFRLTRDGINQACFKNWQLYGNSFANHFIRCTFEGVRCAIDMKSGNFHTLYCFYSYCFDISNPGSLDSNPGSGDGGGFTHQISIATAPCSIVAADCEEVPNFLLIKPSGSSAGAPISVRDCRIAMVPKLTKCMGSSNARDFITSTSPCAIEFKNNLVTAPNVEWDPTATYPVGVVNAYPGTELSAANSPLWRCEEFYSVGRQVQYGPSNFPTYENTVSYLQGQVIRYRLYGVFQFYKAKTSTTGNIPTDTNYWAAYVNYGKYYVCKTEHTSSDTIRPVNTGYWTRLEPYNVVQYTAPYWDSSTVYAVTKGVLYTGTQPVYSDTTAYAPDDVISYKTPSIGIDYQYYCISASTGNNPTNSEYWKGFSGNYWSLQSLNTGNTPGGQANTYWKPNSNETLFKNLKFGNNNIIPTDYLETPAWQSLLGVGNGIKASDEFSLRVGGGGSLEAANIAAPIIVSGNVFPTPRWYETDPIQSGGATIISEGNTCYDVNSSGVDPRTHYRILAGSWVPTRNEIYQRPHVGQPNMIDNTNNITTLTGLSTSNVQANNLAGTFTFNTGTTGCFPLPVAEADDGYTPVLSLATVTAPATTTRIWITSYTAKQINWAVDNSPMGNLVKVSWIIIRHAPIIGSGNIGYE